MNKKISHQFYRVYYLVLFLQCRAYRVQTQQKKKLKQKLLQMPIKFENNLFPI